MRRAVVLAGVVVTALAQEDAVITSGALWRDTSGNRMCVYDGERSRGALVVSHTFFE